MSSFTISGQLTDLFQRRIYPAKITVRNGYIAAIEEVASAPSQYIMPGFVDAHIHIESSMLVPSAFAHMAVVHGTVATVSDPHEIANVMGMWGVQFMIDNSKQSPFRFFFGAPSCVPATSYETAGYTLDADAVKDLLHNDDIWYLSEVMNYPGVLHGDAQVAAKIAAARAAGKPVDGHAPGMRGADVVKYAAAGITTDHECFTLDEALDKIEAGMSILIREGSAAKNFEALCELIQLHPDKVMFCSDDKHPDELVLHHINALVQRAVQKGYDLFDVLRAACVNPVYHYDLPVGLLQVHHPADFIVVKDLEHFGVLQTFIGGDMVARNGKSLMDEVPVLAINNFKAEKRTAADFRIKARSETPVIRVIEAIEGQLVTNCTEAKGKVENGYLVSDTEQDILKIVVVNRYEQSAPAAVAFVRNFGLKSGAIASTVAHDSHNIIAVGTDDDSICAAVNRLVECKGGIAVAVDGNTVSSMPLEVAGLMSVKDGREVAADYSQLDAAAKKLGCQLHAPFMTMSFMALLVIPALKLSDKGLFDGTRFEFTHVEVS